MGMIAAGRLDRRVAILREAAVRLGSFGAESGGRPVRELRWASRRLAQGGEAFDNARADDRRRHSYWFRHDALTRTLTTADALEDDGVRYEIVAVAEIGRREGVEVIAVAAPGASA